MAINFDLSTAGSPTIVAGASGTNTLTLPTSTGTLMTTTDPVASATTATNIAGGAANRIPVQTGAGATGFIVAPTVSSYLQFDGANFAWTTPSGTGGGSPGGNSGEIQFNSGGAFAGAANVEVHGGDLNLQTGTPTTPTSGVKIFAKSLASRILPASMGPAGLDAALQPSIWRQKIATWRPIGAGSTAVPTVDGIVAFTATGTATARALATTNLLTRTRRLAYASAATAGSFAALHNTTAYYTTGDGAGLGGFFLSWRFAITDPAAVSGARMFCGISSSVAAATNAEPSSLTNSVGVAQLSTDSTQLFIVYGGSAAQTAIGLGTNFPPMAGVGTTNGILYDLTLFSPPSSNGVVHYMLERVGTTFVASGTLTPATPGTQTPSNTTLMAPRIWRTNNATALAVNFDVVGLYAETDY